MMRIERQRIWKGETTAMSRNDHRARRAAAMLIATMLVMLVPQAAWAQGTPPPAPQTAPPLVAPPGSQIETITVSQTDTVPYFPEAMRPSIEAYQACLAGELPKRAWEPTSDFQGVATEIITGCKPARAAAFADAQRRLADAPGADRDPAVINAAFDGIDASFRRFMETIRARVIETTAAPAQ